MINLASDDINRAQLAATHLNMEDEKLAPFQQELLVAGEATAACVQSLMAALSSSSSTCKPMDLHRLLQIVLVRF